MSMIPSLPIFCPECHYQMFTVALRHKDGMAVYVVEHGTFDAEHHWESTPICPNNGKRLEVKFPVEVRVMEITEP